MCYGGESDKLLIDFIDCRFIDNGEPLYLEHKCRGISSGQGECNCEILRVQFKSIYLNSVKRKMSLFYYSFY